MSWDPSSADFSTGNVDFSSGNATGGEFSGRNDFRGSNNYHSAPPAQESHSAYGGRDRGERPPPTEEQVAHRNYNWASNKARYEFNENAVDDKGMAARDDTLEKELFEDNAAEQQTHLNFSKYEKIPVKVERGQAPPPLKSFDEAILHPIMKENVRLARYTSPTPVQSYSIPIVTAGKDLMASAQTGSGKTAAFLIPTLSALFSSAKELQKPRPAPYETRSYKAEPLVLIIAPTRELCSQIFDECRRFTYRSSLRPCAVYGGADARSQLTQLERGCDVLAAAPGRLMDFIERGKVGLDRVKYLILDEADRMLDMGFEAVIRALISKKGMPQDRQTLLFSATFPRSIRVLARDFLRPDYLFLKVGRVGGTSDNITQKVMLVEEEDKREALRELLNSQPPSRTLIFVETKRSADSLDHYLFERSFPSTSIHGDRTQMEREDALLAFKRGKCPILVATAVAARGIDIKNVMHVINYDMPQDFDEYIHRIGRTARVGKTGLATSFYNSRSEMMAPDLAKILKENNQEIPDFLLPYVPEGIEWDEDLDDNEAQAPSYAGQEYVPMERTAPGAPQGYNNAEATGAADGAWDSGNTGGGYGGGDRGSSRPGDWNCPECSQSNFASRFECFKCHAAKPEGAGGNAGGFSGGERRERPPRREGDWDCSGCNAVNYAFRNDCFRCHAPKGEEGGASSGYNNGGYSSYDQPGSTDNAALDASNWDSSATAGWGSSESAAPVASSGEWGASAATEAPAASDGWGASEPAAPTASAGGWGEPAAPKAASPAPVQATPVQAAPVPAAPATSAPAADGWGEAPPVAAGGWGNAPAATNGAGW